MTTMRSPLNIIESAYTSSSQWFQWLRIVSEHSLRWLGHPLSMTCVSTCLLWSLGVLVRIYRQFGVSDLECRHHVVDGDIRFVRELVLARFGVFDEVTAQTVSHWYIFSMFVDDADVIYVALQLQNHHL